MKNTKMKREDLALQIAAMVGHSRHSNYADGLAETAELYEQMTGEKIGSEDIWKTADKINGRENKTYWQKIKSYFSPLK